MDPLVEDVIGEYQAGSRSEISHLRMAGEEQTDSAGKYGMSGRDASDRESSPKWWPVSLKIFELLLACACIGLIDDPANNRRAAIFVSPRTVGLAYTTFGSFAILTGVYVLGKVIRDNWPWKTSAVLSFIGAVLFIATSAALLADWANTKERNYWPPNTQSRCELLLNPNHKNDITLDLLCAAGFVSMVGAVVFLVDLVLTIRFGMKGRFEY